MKGGFWNTLSSWGSSVWDKTKNAASGLTGSTSSTYTPPPPAPTTNPSMTTSTFGGKHRRSRRRHMRGGFEDNTPTTGLAAHAASFSGQTAQPQTIVGGRTRRRGRKGGFLGEVVNQAIVPVSILAMQQKYRKGGKTHKHRRHRRH
jgi:hypothetical protein